MTEDHLQLIFDERVLDRSLDKLTEQMNSPERMKNVTVGEKLLMNKQLDKMCEYQLILAQRINLIPNIKRNE